MTILRVCFIQGLVACPESVLSLPFFLPLLFFLPPSPFSYFLSLPGSVLGFGDTLKRSLYPQQDNTPVAEAGERFRVGFS